MAQANAASVALIYTGSNDIDDDGNVLAAVGDTLQFDLVADFTDDITVGGGLDVNFNPAVFEFGSYISADLGDPAFGRDPIEQSDRLFNGAVGSNFPITQGLIASMTFTYLGGTGLITPSGTTGDNGPWISAIDFISLIEPDYVGAQVGFVPVPAAVWFLLSGIGALCGIRRYKLA